MSSAMKMSGEQLENAFLLFNQMSEKLALSYGELDTRVAELSAELAEARSERLKQLAEKEVLASRLEGLLNTLPAAIVVVDAEGCINQVNAIAEQMLGDDLLGQSWSELAQKMIVAAGDELRLNDGRWVSISTRALNAEPGKIILITDVSDTRELQAVVNRKQRLTSLGEMLASLAHQIRTPLASALLYLSNSSHPDAQQSDRERYIEKSCERLHHLNRMVNDMLTFARGGESTSENIDLISFIEQLEQLLEPQLTKSAACLRIDNKVKQACLLGNRDALLGAFQNLTSNALEACEGIAEQRPELNLSVSSNEGMLEFEFSDNGSGIEDDIKERLLEPFFTTRSSGTGLGLAVVNATVNSHGGRLEIHSNTGQGSCFNITLPLLSENAILPSELDARPHSRGLKSHRLKIQCSHRQQQHKYKNNHSNYLHQIKEVTL